MLTLTGTEVGGIQLYPAANITGNPISGLSVAVHISYNGVVVQSNPASQSKIQIFSSDIPTGSLTLKFRELQVVDLATGVLEYCQVLCSQPYPTALGNT